MKKAVRRPRCLEPSQPQLVTLSAKEKQLDTEVFSNCWAPRFITQRDQPPCRETSSQLLESWISFLWSLPKACGYSWIKAKALQKSESSAPLLQGQAVNDAPNTESGFLLLPISYYCIQCIYGEILALLQAAMDYLFISQIFFPNYIVLPGREILYLFI